METCTCRVRVGPCALYSLKESLGNLAGEIGERRVTPSSMGGARENHPIGAIDLGKSRERGALVIAAEDNCFLQRVLGGVASWTLTV